MTMLFLKQKSIQNADPHTFHIVNMNSIGGHVTCRRNSDYSASKFALTGFTDALRQELGSNTQIALTNFYPYYINTGLFEGFKPILGSFLPTLDANYVARKMYTDIMAEKNEVYIYGIIYWLKIVNMLLPLRIRHWIQHILVGAGMEHFVGRQNDFI